LIFLFTKAPNQVLHFSNALGGKWWSCLPGPVQADLVRANPLAKFRRFPWVVPLKIVLIVMWIKFIARVML
jgi:hypothetical protein